ncbi:MAG: hypothetical protein M1829_005280 [Trizodia sp. TS-e1964]|nr:MAG: hypothetical protein M1829_005280 [Trizodia sp. TS-e1964]
MDTPVNVAVDDPDADTEWNDILRKHGVIPEKAPSPTPLIEEALAERQRLAHETRLEGKGLDELDALEDVEDEAFLHRYRQQRVAELASISRNSLYGQVIGVQKPDYGREVTEASLVGFVAVLLTASNVESRVASELWQQLARKYGDIKFCEMRGAMCIEGYPDRNCPTLLVYRRALVLEQAITLRELRGEQTRLEGTSRCPALPCPLHFPQQHNQRQPASELLTAAAVGCYPDVEALLIKAGALAADDVRVRGDKQAGKLQRGRGEEQEEEEEEDDWD